MEGGSYSATLTRFEPCLGQWVAGWTYISEDHHVFLRSPDYTHGSACRGETLSRFDFHLVLEREGWKTVEQVLVPCTVLVLISFIAFFIDIKTLMPRIAVGFLTFLTMTNWEASTVETFASQEHPVWFIEFFKLMRLIVAMTLWQVPAPPSCHSPISPVTSTLTLAMTLAR